MSSSSSIPTFPPQEGDAETNEELYGQFTELVSSWPCSRGLSRANQLYRHEKGWYSTLPPMVGAMVADARFAARPSDIVVATMPKSGTTWMKALLYSTVNRKEHPPGGPGHPFNSLGPHECIRHLEYQLYTHVPLASLPRSVAASACRIVYVCRDPKDTLVSTWTFVNKFRAEDGLEPISVETAADYFCDGVSASGPYWDHALGYWRAHLANPERVLFFRYEEMSRDPAAHVRRLAEFVGRPFSAEEEEDGAVDAVVKLCSFFRRGLVGDWENYLSPETARKIDAITEAKFRGFGLSV
ncbi:unnamed protein product [Triticum turgidum subsp. durum]|uniref:Sulfotransferase n=1 Tax=Triticum turgidum subsp. durum TaxID=4567 RepID=A0A9R1RPY5_TRITD|nr:unnamed protein product [Triticum turgidum subsp. durum]